MMRFLSVRVACLVIGFTGFVMNVTAANPSLEWKQLPPLPDHEGFATPFAGVSGGALIVAGGANFPDKRPWEGGTKTWYDSIFVLEDPAGAWKLAGQLPRPIAYGVTVNTDDGVLCIGGGDAKRHYRDVFLLAVRDGKLETTTYPSLPLPCAFFCGARVGNTVYVAGGIETPTATRAMNNFWALDLDHVKDGWKTLPCWPGPERMLGVAASLDGDFLLISGTKLRPNFDGTPVREYLKDAYRYTPGRGWWRIADLPWPTVAAPTPAVATAKSRVLVFSGDDGSKIGFKPPEQHPGFSRAILSYDSNSNTWTKPGETPAPNVTTSLTPWRDGYVVPSGEKKPGFRTPEVWFATPIK